MHVSPDNSVCFNNRNGEVPTPRPLYRVLSSVVHCIDTYRHPVVTLFLKEMHQKGQRAGKKELQEEYDGYEKLLGEITAYMTEKGYETKELGVMKKMFMSSGIKMNTALDNTEGHIAQIMVKGTVMGITELCRLLNNTECTDPKVIELGERLKQLEENYEERLKKFL